MSALQIAIVGMGNVGTGVAKILTTHADTITRRAGRPIKIRRASVRDLSRDRGITLPEGVLTDEIESIISDPNISLVVLVDRGAPNRPGR